MLPLVLVLLVAQTAFAAPSLVVDLVPINEIAPPRDNGRLVSSYLTSGALEQCDGGEKPVNILPVEQGVNDLANQNELSSQALAVSQAIAITAELASGLAGDACDSAALVNAFANAVRSGNNAGLRQALANYVRRIQTNIDILNQITVSPDSLRYSTGPAGRCIGGGRTYQFEAAWDAILASATPSQIGLLNEEYCASKRLYSAVNARSNNIGAAVTAASVPQVVQIIQGALPSVANFLRAVASGGNPSQAAAVAKAAIGQAAQRIRL